MNEKAKKYVLLQQRTKGDSFGYQVAWDITDENGDGFYVSWREFLEDFFVPDWRNPECMAFRLSAKEGVKFNPELAAVYGLDAEESLEKIIEMLGIDVDLDQSASVEVQE